MKKVTQSEDDIKNYDEYENFENNFESKSNNRDSNSNKDGNSRRNNNNNHLFTHSNNIDPLISQQYDPETGGNNYDRANDRRDANSYQFTYNDNNNFNNRYKFYGSQSHDDGHRNDSNDANVQHERDRTCVLQCFFQELKMVRRAFSFYFFFRFLALPRQRCKVINRWTKLFWNQM